MTDFDDLSVTLVVRLERAGLFDFSSDARGEIDGFFAGNPPLPNSLREQGRALTYLHAAEFALLPAFSDPGSLVLPPRESVSVSAAAARLGILKGDCSLIIWTHAPKPGVIEELRSSDVTVFSGDASKLDRQAADWVTSAAADGGRIAWLDSLQSLHSAVGWRPAAQVADSGVVLLQGLLWRLKLAVVLDTALIDVAIDEFRSTAR